jgi:hypothetical protein
MGRAYVKSTDEARASLVTLQIVAWMWTSVFTPHEPASKVTHRFLVSRASFAWLLFTPLHIAAKSFSKMYGYLHLQRNTTIERCQGKQRTLRRGP